MKTAIPLPESTSGAENEAILGTAHTSPLAGARGLVRLPRIALKGGLRIANVWAYIGLKQMT